MPRPALYMVNNVKHGSPDKKLILFICLKCAEYCVALIAFITILAGIGQLAGCAMLIMHRDCIRHNLIAAWNIDNEVTAHD